MRTRKKPTTTAQSPYAQQPGAQRIAGINGENEESTIVYRMPSLSDEVRQQEMVSRASQQQQDLILEAELVPDEDDLEERIEERVLHRIIENAPIAEHVAPEDTPADTRAPHAKHKNKKRWWVCLGVLLAVLILAGLAVGLAFGLKKDDGPEPIDTKADDCVTGNDGVKDCAKKDIPTNFLITLFQDCPSADNVFECQQCQIYAEESLQQIDVQTTPSCRGCMVCRDSLAYDCLNLNPGETSFRDCNGKGRGASAALQADECSQVNGTMTCFKEAFPETFLLTRFQDCPSGDNVFECETCSVIFEDSAVDIDEHSLVCNSCLVCGGSVSYDCSNLSENDPCARKSCDGSCVG